MMQSDVFGEDIKKLFPIIMEGKSDSASMDMVVELLLMTGRIASRSNDDDGS